MNTTTNDNSKAYTGGCACGAIRYDIPDEPIFMNHCQCRDCQRKSGTGHGSYLTFQRKALTLKGEATQWNMVGDSGNVANVSGNWSIDSWQRNAKANLVRRRSSASTAPIPAWITSAA
jgi:hypothetical protein